jgi:hypothetical protein
MVLACGQITVGNKGHPKEPRFVIAASRIARADDRRVDFGLIASAAYATIAAVTADMRLVRNVQDHHYCAELTCDHPRGGVHEPEKTNHFPRWLCKVFSSDV